MIAEAPTISWLDANQRYLSEAVAGVRARLEAYVARIKGTGGQDQVAGGGRATAVVPGMPAPPALETLCATFGLSLFERDLLLLCAGMELDGGFAALSAAAQGDPQRVYPTFSLALAALPDPHWSALTPSRPLRRWRLIEVGAGNALTHSPLRIDERIVHYLAGIQHIDERLVSIAEPVEAVGKPVPSHREIVERLVSAWTKRPAEGRLPLVQLCGTGVEDKRAIAAGACATLGLQLHVMPADVVPSAPGELENLVRLWTREAALSAVALLLDCDEVDPSDALRAGTIARLVERMTSPIILSSRDRWQSRLPVIAFDVRKPTHEEQRDVWLEALGNLAPDLDGHLDMLASQFSLSAPSIRSATVEVTGERKGELDLGASLWDACRLQARPRLDDLAQRIEPAAVWDDLVLPELQHQILREIAGQVRQRATVYETWGFSSRGARGLGISALFAGPSGTGKTMAAEVLANELRLDLYRIDLSSVVSKYIGETEKNLRRVFDAADDGGAILLFDEADALFGKRSEVKDSHDRYANIEVSYLLQRMEAYRGLAILTTNLKKALDPAFLRRIRFVVQFPFPDAEQRAEIWRRIFPAATPREGLDTERLARLNVAGGNIRSIALNAAFLAAAAGEPVQMGHLLLAAQTEYVKLERALTDTEFGSWT
jgi:hypothetical protein